MASAYEVSVNPSVTTAVSLQSMGFTGEQVAGMNDLAITSDVELRYLSDQDPTSTFGHTVPAGETVFFTAPSPNFGLLKFVSTSGSAVVTATARGYA